MTQRVLKSGLILPAGTKVLDGTGSPEGVVTAPAGSLYLDTGGTPYRKASGAGNTGWISLTGGAGSPGGATGEVQYNNAGAFAGAADVEIEGGQLRLPSISTPATPAAGGLKLWSRSVAGRAVPSFLVPSGQDSGLQPFLGRNRVCWARPVGGAATLTAMGLTLTATGTLNLSGFIAGALHTTMDRVDYLVTTAATTAVAGFRQSANTWWRGNVAGQGGFFIVIRWGPATGVATTTMRAFTGISASTAAPTDVEPSSLVNMIGMGWDAADAQVQVMTNDGTGTATKTALTGTGFAVPTTDRTAVYELVLYAPPNGASVQWQVTNLVTSDTQSGTITTDLPASTTSLSMRGYCSVGGTSSVIGYALMSAYGEADL